MSEAELRAEIDFHEQVREAIASMRTTTADLLEQYEDEFNEGKENRFDGDKGPDKHLGFSMARQSTERLADLADRDVAYFFGRLWFDDGEDYRLGRRHVRDQDSNPMVLDWRAPLSERFYRASAHDRHDVAKRRRYGFQGSQITGFEDEDLTLGEETGSDILRAEIERPRTGPMRDIVATIQPEQDELIRENANLNLCVQGAPGTGKTAVGLHRAAWLLYNHPKQVRKSGLLVIGPNEGFLSYISAVLPTLGEKSVRQMTVESLTTSGYTISGTDTPSQKALKHDPRLADVARRAVWAHLGAVEQSPFDAQTPLEVSDNGWVWRLGVKYLEKSLNTAREVTTTWSAGRENLLDALTFGLRRQAEIRAGVSPDEKWVRAMKRSEPVQAFMEAVWPRLKPREVLRRLYTDADFRAQVCDGILSEDETRLLAVKGKAMRLSAADALILDEISAVVEIPDPSETFAHIVIDEAQDLSPMQCRAIARRSGQGSITVLGDLAQGTTPWAATKWSDQIHHLGKHEATHTELTTGYRVPGAIISLANRMLPDLAVDVAPARSLRSDGSVEFLPVDDATAGVRKAVDEALELEGAVGVIASDHSIDRLRPELPEDARVELVPASLAKGLEYDHVVVVEPEDIIAAEGITMPVEGAVTTVAATVGLRHLYVALTRAVSRLTVVHSGELPSYLRLLRTI
ncbi:HelD family protein [Haloglycomyces albus]|uniref:HelD family protein n=1 Tax=Haloglycomyces albus TaxID=526067 RepID=UPI00046D66EA|nr:AAA family ATPase [Haloglycomyces albus]